jgi:hypothetical protein
MNTYFTFIAVSILVFWQGAAGAQPPADLDGCNRLYHDGAYQQAIACYESIGTSTELLFNIGNSFAQMGQPGKAVLFYLRALCLSPEDADVRTNLAQIRREHSLFPPDPSFADRLFSALTISQWSYLCLAVPVLYLAFLLSTKFRKRRRTTIGTVTLVCTLLLALCGAGAWYHWQQWQRSVVLTDDRLLLSPFDKSESVGAIDQGRLVTVHRSYGDYVYVTDETGRKGWLHGKSRAPILPDPR